MRRAPWTPTKIRANGTATSLIHVDGGTKTPLKIAATKGTFVESGSASVQVNATTADVTLQACDGLTDPTCTTSITVSALDGDYAIGRAVVSLIPRETTCNDGVDNDCNGFTDCADAACDGKQCGPTATSVCQNKTCVDIGAGVGLSLVTARSRLPADGSATTTVTATVTKSGVPTAGLQVTLQTTLGTFAGALAPGTAITVGTDASGNAVATFQASAAAGIATITAFPTAVPQLTATAQIAMPALGSTQVSSVQNPVMGVKYSGFNEQNAIAVLLLDTEQKPYPDGLQVVFEHLPLGGSQISTPWTDGTVAPDLCAQPSCLRFLGATQ